MGHRPDSSPIGTPHRSPAFTPRRADLTQGLLLRTSQIPIVPCTRTIPGTKMPRFSRLGGIMLAEVYSVAAARSVLSALDILCLSNSSSSGPQRVVQHSSHGSQRQNKSGGLISDGFTRKLDSRQSDYANSCSIQAREKSVYCARESVADVGHTD
ncbi:hypothetical protein HG531_000931 [Fusarium graminearum]|nr:hypothetical protein HG531_000931 [Fusarium graminearum]